MSYILQALQRAEAERKRGTTPGLDTPAAMPGTAAAPRGRGALPWLMAGAAAVLGGAVVAWWLWPAAAVAPPVTPVAQAPAPVPAPAPAPAPAPMPVTVPNKAAAGALPETPIVAAPPEPVGKPEPVAKPEPMAPRRAASAPAAVAQTPSPAPVPAVPQPQTQPAPGAERLPTLQELPASLRQAMPSLAVTGGVHSPEPANRMLIVNGQVLREKAQLGPELVLESIGSRSAVFRFRGTRFEVGY